jgi:hypothetical protein
VRSNLCLTPDYYKGFQIAEHQIGGAYSKHGRNAKFVLNFVFEVLTSAELSVLFLWVVMSCGL